MATKFYLNRSNSDYTPPAWYGGWTDTSWDFAFGYFTGDFQFDPDSVGEEVLEKSKFYDPSVNPQKTTLFRGITRILMPQTIDGTVDAIFALQNRNVSVPLNTRLHIVVINETTDTVVATLLNGYEDSGVWPDSSSGFSTDGFGLAAPQTLTPYTVPNDGADYRMIVEIGTNSNATGSSQHRSIFSIGSRTSVLLGLEIATHATVGGDAFLKSGYFTFSANITFEPHNKSNINKETATILPNLTNSFTVDPFGPWELWYKVTPSTNISFNGLACNSLPRIVNLLSFGGPNTGHPKPYQTWINSVGAASRRPGHGAAKIGVPVYFVISNPFYQTGDTIIFTSALDPQGTIQTGDVYIVADGQFENYYDPTIPGLGESLWYTPNGTPRLVNNKNIATRLAIRIGDGKWTAGAGESFNEDIYNLVLYGPPPAMTELWRINVPAVVPGPLAADPDNLGTDFVNIYHVIQGTGVSFNQSKVRRISPAGVIDTTEWTLPVNAIGGTNSLGQGTIGISRDGTILYYGHDDEGGQCRRHSLVTDTEILPAFPQPSGGPYYGSEVIVLSNNTIVCGFYAGATGDCVCHYSASGTILREIHYADDPYILHHFCHTADDAADKIWIAVHDATVPGLRLQLVNLTSGAVEQNWTIRLPQPETTCTTNVGWKVPLLGPIMTMVATDSLPPATDIGGIYYINPVKATQHDSYYGAVEKKIPDPKVRTSLMGE